MITLDATTLRGRREALKISQARLAKLIKYRTETINRYERNKIPIPYTVQIALTQALDMLEENNNFLQGFQRFFFMK